MFLFVYCEKTENKNTRNSLEATQCFKVKRVGKYINLAKLY